MWTFSSSELGIEGRFGNTGSWTTGSSSASFAGTYGTFTLSAVGVWVYTVNNAAAAVQALGAGQTETDVLNVRPTDTDGVAGDTRTVTVTITGVNDAPTL